MYVCLIEAYIRHRNEYVLCTFGVRIWAPLQLCDGL